MKQDYKFETLCLHAGRRPDPTTFASEIPVCRSSSYVFKNAKHAADLFALKEPGNIYSRIMNPTQQALEERISLLEGAKGSLALASGTAAVFYTIINICSAGDEIVSANNLYGGTYTMFDSILPNFGIKVRFVNPNKPENFEKQINKNTKGIYIETIGNPSLDFTDIGKVSEIAKKYNIPLIVDGTFTTPWLLKTIEFGADIVVNSITKWMGGHGCAIGGAVSDSGKFDWTDSKFKLYNEPDPSYHGIRFAHDLGESNNLAFIVRMRNVALRNLGACISADNAWMFFEGLQTLPLRMERHCYNAFKTAEFLKGHKKVSWVRYPGLKDDPCCLTASKYLKKGFGAMVVFGIKGGIDAGRRFIERLKLFSHLANVGDVKSLALHPASTVQSQLSEKQQAESGLMPELIRLSIGIEHIDDILEDISFALE